MAWYSNETWQAQKWYQDAFPNKLVGCKTKDEVMVTSSNINRMIVEQ